MVKNKSSFSIWTLIVWHYMVPADKKPSFIKLKSHETSLSFSHRLTFVPNITSIYTDGSLNIGWTFGEVFIPQLDVSKFWHLKNNSILLTLLTLLIWYKRKYGIARSPSKWNGCGISQEYSFLYVILNI
jgi:hypothetical protein